MQYLKLEEKRNELKDMTSEAFDKDLHKAETSLFLKH